MNDRELLSVILENISKMQKKASLQSTFLALYNNASIQITAIQRVLQIRSRLVGL
jgi:hypothetical protein